MQPGVFRRRNNQPSEHGYFWPILFLDGSFVECRSEQTAIPAARVFISFYLALVYLKPLPELGLALPLQKKKLSDVMASGH